MSNPMIEELEKVQANFRSILEVMLANQMISEIKVISVTRHSRWSRDSEESEQSMVCLIKTGDIYCELKLTENTPSDPWDISICILSDSEDRYKALRLMVMPKIISPDFSRDRYLRWGISELLWDFEDLVLLATFRDKRVNRLDLGVNNPSIASRAAVAIRKLLEEVKLVISGLDQISQETNRLAARTSSRISELTVGQG